MYKVTQVIVQEAEKTLQNRGSALLRAIKGEGWITQAELKRLIYDPYNNWVSIKLMLAIIMLEIYDEELLLTPEEN